MVVVVAGMEEEMKGKMVVEMVEIEGGEVAGQGGAALAGLGAAFAGNERRNEEE